MSGGDNGGSVDRYLAALARDRAALTEAGLHGHRSPEEWVARWNERPELFDDLIDALCGDLGPRATDKQRRRVA